MNHWGGDSPELYPGTQDESGLVLDLFSDGAPEAWGLSAPCPDLQTLLGLSGMPGR